MEHIRIFDFAGREITRFAQWDKNVSIIIRGIEIQDNPVVLFYSAGTQASYKVDAIVSENCVSCAVPSVVLQHANPVTVTIGYSRQGGKELVSAYYTTVQVLRREKPINYIDEIL